MIRYDTPAQVKAYVGFLAYHDDDVDHALSLAQVACPPGYRAFIDAGEANAVLPYRLIHVGWLVRRRRKLPIYVYPIPP